MRTRVYIDGFNLYYGSLRGSDFKWVDPVALSRVILPRKNKIDLVRFFTAKISARGDDPDAPQRQQTYLDALDAHCSGLEIHYGHFLVSKVRMRLASPIPGGPTTAEVVKTEEKGSDVNLAVHMLNDAWRNDFDVAVVLSNDSDLAEPMRMVREMGKTVGLLTPEGRRLSKELKQYASFMRPVRIGAIRRCQMPSPIPGTGIHKPKSW